MVTADTSEADSNSKAFSRFRARSKTLGTPDAIDALPVTDDVGPTDTSEAAGTPIDHRMEGHEPPGPRPQRRGTARALLSLFLVAGLAAAVVAGWQWKNVATRHARQSFDQRASAVAAKVTKELQRDTDLTTTSRAVIEQNPDMTNVQLTSLFSALAPSDPNNTKGLTYIEKVSSAQLYYFRVAIGADPTSALSAGEPFTITPSGAQAPYCMTRLLALRSSLKSAGDVALPPGLDWCSTSVNGALDLVD